MPRRLVWGRVHGYGDAAVLTTHARKQRDMLLCARDKGMAVVVSRMCISERGWGSCVLPSERWEGGNVFDLGFWKHPRRYILWRTEFMYGRQRVVCDLPSLVKETK